MLGREILNASHHIAGGLLLLSLDDVLLVWSTIRLAASGNFATGAIPLAKSQSCMSVTRRTWHIHAAIYFVATGEESSMFNRIRE
jgi:hypothetical protein